MKNKKIIRDLLLVIIGNLLLAIAVGVFILPFNILSGGVAGIAVALEPIIHVDPKTTVDCLVIGMFILGFIFLGKQFALKTVVSSVIYPTFLTFVIAVAPTLQLDAAIASLYGGLIAGIGIGIVFRTGSSTGGMDIPPLIINKLTNIKIAVLVMIVDMLTVILGVFSYGVEAVLIGFLSVFVCSVAIDKVLVFGGVQTKAVQIISKNYQEVIKQIHDTLNRGTTITDVQGGYSQEKKKIVLVVITKDQYPRLLELVSEIDSEAFVIVNDATEVKGSGFTYDFKI